MYHASAKASIHFRLLLGLALTGLSLLGSACGDSPTSGTTAAVVHVEPGTFDFYFSESEKRANLWFCGERVPGKSCNAMPDLPAPSAVLGRVRFVEEAPLGQTCYYDTATNTIAVPSDKWDSGCVPHEVLHAALDMIHNRCWREIEHRPFDGRC